MAVGSVAMEMVMEVMVVEEEDMSGDDFKEISTI